MELLDVIQNCSDRTPFKLQRLAGIPLEVEAFGRSFQLFVAGFSSGGNHALLLAAHVDVIAGCVAYCPDANMGDFTPRALQYYGEFLPGLNELVKRVSPSSYAGCIRCPTLLFASEQDEIVEFAATARLFEELRSRNPACMIRWTDKGSHVEAYESVGLGVGTGWLRQIADRED